MSVEKSKLIPSWKIGYGVMIICNISITIYNQFGNKVYDEFGQNRTLGVYNRKSGSIDDYLNIFL